MVRSPGLLIAAAALGVFGLIALSMAANSRPNPFMGADEVARAAAAAQPWTIAGWVAIGLGVLGVLLYIAAKPAPAD